MNPDVRPRTDPPITGYRGAVSSAAPGWSSADAGLALLVGLGALRIYQTLLFGLHLPGRQLNTTLWLVGASGILFSAAVVAVRRCGRRDVTAALGMRLPQPIDVAVGVPVGIALFFGTMSLQQFINEHFASWVNWYAGPRTSVDLGHGPWIGAGFLLVLVVPLGEEALFRGFFHRGLRNRYSLPAATMLSAAVFAIYHVDPAVMPAIFLDGVVLALAFEWRKTLGMPTVIHGSILACFLLREFVLP